MSADPTNSHATAPAPAFLQLHRALADLAMCSGQRAPVAQHTAGRHLAFLPPEALELDLGDPAQRDFGDYELLEKLGQGGMGVVYRARQKSLDREVAVKLLAAGPWASRDFIERFRREAQSAARMQHPNIVSIYEVGAHDELNYFSMQLVRGESLAGLLSREGALAPRRAAALLRTVAEAVDYAHRLGVLHLDLKPGNVLIDERGQPQVADFGLARRLDEALASDNDEVSGTPSYMAPEQAMAKSHRLSPATDVWGLGAILYELLAGRPPFLAASAQETLRRVVAEEAQPLRRVAPSVEADLAAICDHCLAKDPGARYPSARALADDLVGFLDDRPVSVRRLGGAQRLLRAARREPRITALAALLVAALVGGLFATGLQWQRAERGTDQVRHLLWSQRIEAADRLQAEHQPFAALPLLLANTGEAEAIGDAASAATHRARVGTLLANAPRLIGAHALGEPISAVAIAPDGEAIAIGGVQHVTGQAPQSYVSLLDRRSGRERWRRKLAGLSHFLATDQSEASELAFTADGSAILVFRALIYAFPMPSGMDMVLLDAASGEPHLPPPAAFPDLRDISFSVDGGYALLRDTAVRSQLFRVRDWTALGPMRELGDLIVHVGPGARYFASGAANQPEVRVFALPEQREVLKISTPSGVGAWSFDGSGRWLALGLVDGGVLLVDCDNRTHRALTPAASAAVLRLHFSSDGATLSAGAADGTLLQWTLPSGTRRLAERQDGTRRGGLAVDASGTLLASGADSEWGLNRETATDLWRMPDRSSPDGSPSPLGRLVTGDRFRWGSVALDAGAGLVAVGTRAGTLSLWRLPPSPLRAFRTSAGPAASLAFDGTRVLDVEGRRVTVMDAASGAALSPPVELPDAVGFAALSAQGDVLAIAAGRTLYRLRASDGTPLAPPVALPNSPQRLALARDGRHLVATWLEHRDGHLREAITVLTGTTNAYAAPVDLAGPLSGMDLDFEGRRIIAWRGTRIEVLELPSLRRPYPALDFSKLPSLDAQGKPVAAEEAVDRVEYSDVLAAADRLVVGRTRYVDGRGGKGSICRADLRDGRLGDCRATQASANRLAGDAALQVVASASGLLLREGAATLTYGDSSGASRGCVALSTDGTRLARVVAQGVELFDTRDGMRLSAPLPTDLGAGDEVIQLAFAPDRQRLLGRSLGGRWLLWRLPDDARPLDRVRAESALLQRTELAAPLDAGGAAALAGNDPGIAAPVPRPVPEATRWIGEVPVAPRSAAAPASALDLGPWYNRPLSPLSLRSFLGGWVHTRRPEGLQRLLGVDFDVRGVIELGWAPSGDEAQQSVRVPIAPARIAMLHVLAAAPTRRQDLAAEPYLWVSLHYADGGRLRHPLRYLEEFDIHWDDDGHDPDGRKVPPRVAWLTYPAGSGERAWPKVLVEARVPNPDPDRIVVAVEFEADAAPWAMPWILAATIAPP